MLFTCPQCQTLYDVPDAKARNVHRMRCAVCGRVWDTAPEPGPELSPASGEQEAGPAENLPPDSSDAVFSDVRPETFAPAAEEFREVDFRMEENRDPFDPNHTGDDNVSFDFNAPSNAAKGEDPDFKIPTFDGVFREPEKKTGPGYLAWVKPLYFLSIACLFGAIYLFFFHKTPSVPLTFHAVSYEFIEQDYTRYLIMHAALHNESGKFAKLDTFKIKFFDSRERNILDMEIASPLRVLPAGKTGTFDLRVERPPANAAKVKLVLDTVELSETPFPVPAKEIPDSENKILNKKVEPLSPPKGRENRSPEEGMPVYPKAPENPVPGQNPADAPAGTTEKDDAFAVSSAGRPTPATEPATEAQ